MVIFLLFWKHDECVTELVENQTSLKVLKLQNFLCFDYKFYKKNTPTLPDEQTKNKNAATDKKVKAWTQREYFYLLVRNKTSS